MRTFIPLVLRTAPAGLCECRVYFGVEICVANAFQELIRTQLEQFLSSVEEMSS